MPRIPVDDTTSEAISTRMDDLIWENFRMREAMVNIAQSVEGSQARDLAKSALEVGFIARQALQEVTEHRKAAKGRRNPHDNV